MLSFVAFLATASQAFAELPSKISTIQITGNQRIEASAVENYLGIKPGDSPTRSDLDAALKKIYATGFFNDVSVAVDHQVLRVAVVENPTINEVIFEGNEAIDKKDLEKEIALSSRSVYSRTKVQTDLKRLLDVYRRNGHYSAQITPQIIELPQNRVNLVYSITEGQKAYIEKITFIGNEQYDSSTLAQTINSRRERWFAFLSDSDKYDPDRLQYDQELLRRFYFENGYADFKVKSAIAELSPERDAFYLTFTMEEGPQYRLGTVAVKNSLPQSKLPEVPLAALTTKEGDLYNASEVEHSIDAIVDKMGNAGFAFVEVTPTLDRRADGEKIIDLTYNVKEGAKVYVERINIFNNAATRDEVIRREFRLSEGDAYSSSKIKRTEQRLNNLGYFEKVDIQTKPGSAPDKTQIDVQVDEKSTGEITLGAGLSSTDGPLVDAGITERNFLGRGQELRLRALYARNRKLYNLGFTEPYFLGRSLEAGFDIYKTTEDYSREASYNRDATGMSTRLGYDLSEKLRHQLRYSFEQNNISNVQGSASRYVLDQAGQYSTSMLGHALVYDSRDNKFSPTDGLFVRASQDLAGLGGTDSFLRHEIQGRYYYPIAKRWVLESTLAAGNITGIDKDVRINQRFYIGSDQMRGFARAGIGPRDTTTGDALGGNTYYTFTEELHFPLGLAEDLGVTGNAFVDVGTLYGLSSRGPEIGDSSNLRSSAGVGVSWASQFGPIRVDVAKPLAKESYDKEELIRFSFGTKF